VVVCVEEPDGRSWHSVHSQASSLYTPLVYRLHPPLGSGWERRNDRFFSVNIKKTTCLFIQEYVAAVPSPVTSQMAPMWVIGAAVPSTRFKARAALPLGWFWYTYV